ncbi:cyclase family protein [Methanogenium organophilum]|uniref:Cyclase family protein n=1 Tax=Methanogenium organophilum TaxID=2199 RepID=A0A9X9S1V2_METOG|nr:cyclase family protein [Methanogenium organophilum]WAI00304.1 cyclase family protein [Methanogenium organophilum]
MAYIDLTRSFPEPACTYTGDCVPECRRTERDGYRVSVLVASSHSGTHIDPPAHYIEDGLTIDRISPETFIGPVTIIDLGQRCSAIRPEDIRPWMKSERLIIKTGYSEKSEFDPDYAYLSQDAAALVAASGIRVIGIDTPSIEEYMGTGDVHRKILGAGIPVIEYLDLSAVSAGDYYMIALPLKIRDGDGAPARVIVRTEDI